VYEVDDMRSARAAGRQLAIRFDVLEQTLGARHRLLRGADRIRERIRLTAAPRRAAQLARERHDLFLTTVDVTQLGRRAVVARRRADPRAISAIESHFRITTACLDAESIPYRHVPIHSENRRRIAVLAQDRDRTLVALRQHAPRSAYLYLDDKSMPARRRLHHLASPVRSRITAPATVWRVFEFLGDCSGTDVLDDIYGCEIEFWASNDPAAPALAPQGNSKPVPPITEIDFPVDLVYTWVDGSDPAWIRRRDQALNRGQVDSSHHEAASDARYTSYDELRYSLRSIEKFADFVNHIYLVTDDQRPEWLVPDHPRLTVVSHREIFENLAHLPTFNSHAIESRLHHVPGLCEHYIYMNDDFIFGQRVRADTFFHANGLARFFASSALVPAGGITRHTKPVDAAAINGRDLIAAKFGKAPTQKMRHAPYPQLRSVHLEIEQLFPGEVARTAASRIRSRTDLSIASFLHHHVAFLTARAVPGSITSTYVDLGEPGLVRRLDALDRGGRYDALCLNDSDSTSLTTAERHAVVTRWLRFHFPEASSFER
jgi:hypothetical protein